MNINIDFLRKEEEVKKTPNPELVLDYISYIIAASHKDGVEGQMKRIVGRIQRKIDEAIESKNYEVNFETAELELLQTCFEKAKIPVHLVKHFNILEDKINDEIKVSK